MLDSPKSLRVRCIMDLELMKMKSVVVEIAERLVAEYIRELDTLAAVQRKTPGADCDAIIHFIQGR